MDKDVKKRIVDPITFDDSNLDGVFKMHGVKSFTIGVDGHPVSNLNSFLFDKIKDHGHLWSS